MVRDRNSYRSADEDIDWEAVVDEVAAAVVVVLGWLGVALGIGGTRQQHGFAGVGGDEPCVFPQPPRIWNGIP